MVRCYNCYQMGHISRNCKIRETVERCDYCEKIGEHDADCRSEAINHPSVPLFRLRLVDIEPTSITAISGENSIIFLDKNVDGEATIPNKEFRIYNKQFKEVGIRGNVGDIIKLNCSYQEVGFTITISNQEMRVGKRYVSGGKIFTVNMNKKSGILMNSLNDRVAATVHIYGSCVLACVMHMQYKGFTYIITTGTDERNDFDVLVTPYHEFKRWTSNLPNPNQEIQTDDLMDFKEEMMRVPPTEEASIDQVLREQLQDLGIDEE